MAKTDSQYGGWNSYTLHAMGHDHDIDFARWLHPAMWHVALESWQWIHQVAARDSESGLMHRCCLPVCLFVCLFVSLSVCRQNAKKRDFLKN